MTFVNDIIIFGEATQSNANNISFVLDLSCHGSGQRVNVEKSIVIILKNVQQLHQGILYDYKILNTPGDDFCYLGFLMLKSLRCSSRLISFVQRIEQKVTNKPRPLSQASCLVIIKLVLLVSSVYAMSCYKFPKRVCDLMARLIS